MKNYLELVTTEGHACYDARGMDMVLNVGGKTVRIDPSPKVYQKSPLSLREKEFERQVKLFSRTDILVVSHFHNDHFGVEYMKYRDEKKDILAVYPDSFEKSNAALPPSHVRNQRARMEILKGTCTSVTEVNRYALFKFNGLTMEFAPFKHSSYKGVDLSNVLTAHLIDDNTDLFFSSDVSGPEYDDAREWIIAKDPKFLVLDGPYNKIDAVMGGKSKTAKKAVRALEKSYENLKDVVTRTERLEKVLLCHHFVRGCPMLDNDLTVIPDMLKERLKNTKFYSDTKGFIEKRYDSIGRAIAQLLDDIDDRGIKCYLPGMITDGRIRI